MSRLSPEAKLQGIIADLAAMHVDDMEEILTALTEKERNRVEELMRSVVKKFDEARNCLEAGYDNTKISDWLDGFLSNASHKAGGMTPQARQALRQCAVSLYPLGAAK